MICPDHIAPEQLAVKDLQIAGAQGELAARLYLPKTARSSNEKTLADSLIVFFHAGGFVCGSVQEGDGFCRALAINSALPVLSSSYTLACQQPFPAAAEDAHAVLCWARRNAKKLAWNGKQILTAGIEAGGNLAAVASLMARDRAQPVICAQILLMPMLDPGLNSGSMRALCDKPQVAGVAAGCDRAYRDYLPRAADRTHPYASPLHSSRLKGLPAALLISAEDDPLRDEAEQYAQKLQQAGIHAKHCRLPAVPLQDGAARSACARQGIALTEILNFLQELNVLPAAPSGI